MATETKTFDFPPSRYHRRLVKTIRPRLSYAGGDVAAWQGKLREKLVELVGLDERRDDPLNPRTLWKRDHELGTIEKVVFTSQPDVDVPAYVCLPKGVKPPYQYFICVQGHSSGMHNSIAVEREDNSKPMSEVPGDRDFGLGCMRRGIAALCIEQRCFGERREFDLNGDPNQLCYQGAAHAFMLGRTLIGERVFDVDRGIDYLASRGDADMGRVGVMGNSGGGTTSVFAAALLPRLAYAMPSCYFCTFADSILAMFHCICNFVPRLQLHAEMADVLGLFAPRPVAVVAGKKDDIFPLAAARKEFERLQAIYAAAGAPDRCRLIEGPEGHRFYADLAWPVMKELMGD